jgi:hypothetical protein
VAELRRKLEKPDMVIALPRGLLSDVVQFLAAEHRPPRNDLDGARPILEGYGWSLLRSDSADCIAGRDVRALHRDREVVDQLCRRLAVGKSAEVKPVKMGGEEP